MKLCFLDFWDGFQSSNNFLLDVFQSIYPSAQSIGNPHDADIILYSCFGQSHRQINKNQKTKIFYTGENLRPNFDDCTFSFTFDYPDYGGRNIRFPLWLWQIDFFEKQNYGNPQYVIPYENLFDNEWMKKDKEKFCAGIWNNPEKNRILAKQEIEKYKPFDLYGKTSGNWFYGEKQKIEILSNYKFSICFENAIYSGYMTEKILHSKVSGNIPLYYADEYSNIEFNSKSFINFFDFNNISDFVKRIIELDNNEEEYNAIKSQDLFHYRDYPKEIFEEIKWKIRTALG